jgi:hypothetical protein
MYQLSNSDGLQWFERVFLVSSEQDSYCHFDSARIEINEKVRNSENVNAFREMATNLHNKLRNVKLHKLKV